MKESSLDFYLCPLCCSDLEIAKKIEIYNQSYIKNGLLVCANKHFFLVKDSIPILLQPSHLKSSEKKTLEEFKKFKGQSMLVNLEKYSAKQLENVLRQKITKLITKDKPTKAEQNQIDYNLYYADQKDHLVKTFSKYLKSSPKTILDVGTGVGGLVTSLKRKYKSATYFATDLDYDWLAIAKLREPEVEFFVADATNLPIKNNKFDLTVSAYTLEHILNWQSFVDELSRVSKNIFLTFGPGKYFPYDFGHLNGAVLAPALPKKIAIYPTYLTNKIKGTKKTFTQLKKDLSEMNYVSVRQFEKYLKKSDLSYKNIFVEFIKNALDSKYNFLTIKSHLAKMKLGAVVASKILKAVKVQPYLVYFIKRK